MHGDVLLRFSEHRHVLLFGKVEALSSSGVLAGVSSTDFGSNDR
jgi:hypothetical protein